METKKKHELSLAKRMAISLVCGLVAGLAFMFLREHLNASGQAQTWTTINNLLFQDITAEGAERAFGIFYIIGQLFIKALQLVIIPMVFTSISLAIGSIADTRTMGRISAKTLFWFLLCSFLALLLAGCVGYGTYSMGLFNTHIEGLAEASGSTGSNPLNVVLNVIPSNIVTAFGSNNAVLSSVFLAVAVGLSMNVLGESRTSPLRRLLGEVNDVVVVFLNFVVTNFAPFAVFVLLTRTFAIYGIDYLKPALVYVVVTVVLLFVFLLVAYPLVVALGGNALHRCVGALPQARSGHRAEVCQQGGGAGLVGGDDHGRHQQDEHQRHRNAGHDVQALEANDRGDREQQADADCAQPAVLAGQQPERAGQAGEHRHQEAGQGDLHAGRAEVEVDHVAEDVAEQQGKAQAVGQVQPGRRQQVGSAQLPVRLDPHQQQGGNGDGGDQQLADDGNQPAPADPGHQGVDGQGQ